MLNYTKCQILVFLLLSRFCYSDGKKSSKTIYFLSANVSFNPIYMTHYTMTICRDNRAADIYVGMANAIPSDIWLYVSMTQVTNDKFHSNHLLYYDLNACDILSKMGTRLKGFLTPWLKNFWPHGNLPQSCPVQKGNYSWVGLNMANLNIPLVIPTSKYAVITTSYIRKAKQRDMIGNLSLLIEIK